ncbi:diuretic hormone receptor-like isoform X2 [Rhodnius prolixus]
MEANYTKSNARLLEEAEKCLEQLEADGIPPADYCPRSWDGILCWPPSPSATIVYLPCFEELHGIKYDTSQNASRWCLWNGSWANYSDYDSCSHLQIPPFAADPGLVVVTMIYLIGYGISLIALCVAVAILIYYKDLRCLRNTIHTNLMCTYILAAFMWILNFTLQMSMDTDMVSCIILVILLYYFHLTNFFWMFVEGLYLYMLVVETFNRENIKLRAYLAIGWGSPVAVVFIWAISRSFIGDESNSESKSNVQRGCAWMSPNSSDWINQAPAIIVLAVNLIFLVMIMWVLITKLRSANNVETQQYRKAAKALLVLIPLLGITYILFIVGPTEGQYAVIYSYIRALLLSTQGLTVALFYCFLNTDVQNTVRHHLSRWREARDIDARRYTHTKDWSPNTRTESVRLCAKKGRTPRHYKKRESTVSETTTLTIVGYSSTNRVSNGSMIATTLTVRAPGLHPSEAENAV